MRNSNENNKNMEPEEEQEIDLLELGIKLWNARRRMFLWGICGAVFGLVVAFSIPREYTATVKLVPEAGEAKMGNNLGALAAFAGINMGSGSGSDALSPTLYPDIVSSVPFTAELFNVVLPTDIEGIDSIALKDILLEETSAPWWNYITGLPRRAIGGVRSLIAGKNSNIENESVVDPFRLTDEQREIAKAINGRVEAEFDSKDNTITISVMLQDPVAAASLADTVTKRLQEYVVDYRTGKARKDLEYAKKINDEAREAYYKAQQNYAGYYDRNQGLVSRSAAIEQERLQNEAELAFSLYNSTAQQVQVAEAKVQSNTPVFAVLQPASVPYIPTKPRKMLILIGFVFLAVVAAAAYTLFAPGIVESFKEKSNFINNSRKS